MSTLVPSSATGSFVPDANFAQRLQGLLALCSGAVFQLQATTSEGPAEPFPLTPQTVALLAEIVDAQARGEAVTLLTERQELTTHQAARYLKVSRPFVIEQCERGLIPYRKVGTHRRILLSDLMAYQRANERNRLAALEKLGELDQRLGLGYGP